MILFHSTPPTPVTKNEFVSHWLRETSVARAGDAASGTAASGLAASAAASAADGSIPLPVEEDRRHLVEAAVVRIMKARKALHHNDLIAEVTRPVERAFYTISSIREEKN